MEKALNIYFTIFKILLAILLCTIMSLGVYLAATPVIYAAWHCPQPDQCNSPNWLQWLVLLIFLSPLAIFTFGAYLSRKMISTLTGNKFLRGVIFFIFGTFPILLFIGLIIYIVQFAK